MSLNSCTASQVRALRFFILRTCLSFVLLSRKLDIAGRRIQFKHALKLTSLRKGKSSAQRSHFMLDFLGNCSTEHARAAGFPQVSAFTALISL